MKPAYDKTYLREAQRNLPRLLDYMTNDLHYPLETSWKHFLDTSLSRRFEMGDCSIVAGRSGVELAWCVLEELGIPNDYTEPSYAFDRSPEYWTGWALAYYQWESGLRFAEIETAVPITEVCHLYTPYHEMDIRQFVDRMNELYQAAKQRQG